MAAAINIREGPNLDVRRESVEIASQVFSPRNAPVGSITSFDYALGGKVEISVVLMRIGKVPLVGVQPEPSASIGARIKIDSPF